MAVAQQDTVGPMDQLSDNKHFSTNKNGSPQVTRIKVKDMCLPEAYQMSVQYHHVLILIRKVETYMVILMGVIVTAHKVFLKSR